MDINDLTGKTFRGCFMITRNGETIFQHASGYADYPNRIPNEYNTKYATASAGKVFVAVGILQLIEHGHLRFHDKIGDILDFDLKAIDSQISVEELLTHTSGIPDYFDESIMGEYEELWADFPNYRVRTNKDLLPLFINKPMMYPHGSRFQYNNTGFVVLAIIIEILTGEPFDHYLKKNIFEPCGMLDTGYYELDRLPEKCAFNYIYDEIHVDYRTNIFSVDAKGTGAGGAFTTIKDVSLFWQHLLSNRLLTPEMTENMMKNHSKEAECYGYGIWLEKDGIGYIPYFQGSDPGVSFISCYIKRQDTMVTLVSNYGDNVWEIWRRYHSDFIGINQI